MIEQGGVAPHRCFADADPADAACGHLRRRGGADTGAPQPLDIRGFISDLMQSSLYFVGLDQSGRGTPFYHLLLFTYTL